MSKKEQEAKKNKNKTTSKNKKEVIEEKKEEIVVENVSNKKDKKGKKTANEKLAKERKREAKKNKFVENLKDYDKTTYVIISFILGVAITAIVARIIWPDRIATLKDGTQPVATVNGTKITANDLYEEMKGYYSISQILNDVDKIILEDIYPNSDEINNKAEEQAEYYINLYKNSYGYSEEQILESNGFSSYDEFIDYFKLSYRREKYTDDYIKKNITDKEIDNYYNDKVEGSINCQHILVTTSDKVTEEDAKAKAEKIIKELNDGKSWEDVQKEYKDEITFEDLGYQEWNVNLEEPFLKALKALKDNSYSKEPVQTSYGYHVIYRLDQKEKPTLKDSKDDIIDKIVSDKKAADEKISTKSLIALREEKKLTFSDTVMENKYNKYLKENK